MSKTSKSVPQWRKNHASGGYNHYNPGRKARLRRVKGWKAQAAIHRPRILRAQRMATIRSLAPWYGLWIAIFAITWVIWQNQ